MVTMQEILNEALRRDEEDRRTNEHRIDIDTDPIWQLH